MAKVAASEHQWLLAASLTNDAANPPRSARDWAVDSLLFVLSLITWLLVWADLISRGGVMLYGNEGPSWLVAVDVVVGFLACCALWLRRRWPVQLAVVGALAGLLTLTGVLALFLILFTVVVHRRPAVSAPIAALNVAVGMLLNLYRPDLTLTTLGVLALNVGLVLVIFAWGMFIRARRQLILSLRERAARAEREQRLLLAQARHVERTRLAREMHDVLGHRVSLLAMHAGALEFHPDASPDEVARATGIIRESAHAAMRDLREVISILRADEPQSDHPQRTLDDLPALVDESRTAGLRVDLVSAVEGPRSAPAGLAISAYRIVQEALTNARKHAPGVRVGVHVAGQVGAGVTVRVTNPPAVGPSRPAREMGAGTGLVGLAERVALLGGRLEFGPAPSGEFRVEAWLPWPASSES